MRRHFRFKNPISIVISLIILIGAIGIFAKKLPNAVTNSLPISDSAAFSKSAGTNSFFRFGVPNQAAVMTDKPDYAPGETVLINGSGFLANEAVVVQVTHIEAFQTLTPHQGHDPWVVLADENGNFAAQWLVDEDALFQTLRVTADGNLSGLHAETTFTDGPIGKDFRQCANQDSPYSDGQCHWVNSILHQANSVYYEGMSVPERVIFTSIPATTDNNHNLTLSHLFTKGGTHAYDFLTSYEQAIQEAEDLGYPYIDLTTYVKLGDEAASIDQTFTTDRACGADNSGNGTVCTELRNGLYRFDVPVPNDAFVSKDGSTQSRIDGYEAVYGNRYIRIYANAPITASFDAITHDVANGGDTGDSDVHYTLRWNSTATSILIELAGHLAVSGTDNTGYNWGPTLGSSQINGGPYHFKLHELDGAQLGAQDNQIMGSSVQAPQLGSVTIVKKAIGGNGTFNFQGTGTGIDPTFSLTTTTTSEGNLASIAYSNIQQGAKTVTELGPNTGWQFTSVVCTGDLDGGTTVSGQTANIDLDPNENIVCTFTNTADASLTLDKEVINDNGGTAVKTDFTLSADGSTPISGAGGATGSVTPGTYTLSETNITGYTAGQYSCVKNGGAAVSGNTITLAAGDSATCTIKNDDNAPSLTLKKVVVNDNGGTKTEADFTLTATGPTGFSGVGPTVNNGTSFDAGTYALSETNLTGYTASQYSCVLNGGAPVSGDSITLALGDSAVCTITNDDDAPSLTLKKVVVNDNGGAAAASDFTLTATGPTSFSGVGPTVSNGAGFDAGAYTLSETNLPGYTASEYSCVINGGEPVSGNSVTVALGDTAICTVTNDDNAPSLTLKKVVINDNGGTAAAADFTLTATGPTGFSGLGPTVSNGASFDAGTYNLSETNLPGYAASEYSCALNGGAPVSGDSITLGLGDSGVCTITNDDKEPSLTLKKIVINDNGGSATADNFTLSAGGPTGFSGPGPAVNNGASFDAGTYTLSETNLAGYQAGDYSCVLNGGGAVSGNSVTLGLGDAAVCTITNDDISPKLKLVKTVVNDNGGSLTEADFPRFIDGNLVSWNVAVQVNAGEHTASETQQSGYTASVWGGDCAANGTVTLALADEKTCTITNDDIAPQLHLRKTLVNDNGGSATLADFILTADGAGTNDVSGTHPVDSGPGLKADTFALSETNVAGYNASAWVCTGGVQNGGYVTVGIGESATCTITNDDQPPSLTLNKVVINDNGGTLDESSWTLSANGPTPLTGPGAPGDADIVSGDIFSAGTYNLSETGPGGYTASDWVCSGTGTQNGSNITLANGQSAVCKIVNDDIAPTLTLLKTVVNDNGGNAVQNDFARFVDGAPVDWGVAVTLSAGPHTASETTLAGYLPSGWGGDCAADGTITLGLGETKVCTITNDDIPPSLTLNKVVINDNGGTALESDWTLTADGPTPISGQGASGGSDVVSGADFKAGTYLLSELGPTGYSPSDWVCAGGSQNGIEINVGIGQSAVCTITNDDIQPQLIVIKHVVNDNGGQNAAADFTMNVTGNNPNPATFAGAESPGTNVAINVGGYNVTETGPTGYSASFSADCTGTLAVGEKKTCTVTNDDIGPTLTLLKTVVNDNGGSLTEADFPRFIDGGAVSWSVAVPVNAGGHTASETQQTGYTASVWGGDCAADGSITLALAENKTCTITNNDIAPSLQLVKKVTNNNGGLAVISDFTLTASGPTSISGDGGAISGATFSAGTYALSETNVVGYSASAWDCVGGTQNGSNIQLGLGQSAVCTITNDDKPGTLIVKKIILSPDPNASPDDFSFSINGSASVPFETDGQNEYTVNAGVYNVVEDAASGYQTSYNNCTNMMVPLGGSQTCTITNIYLTGFVTSSSLCTFDVDPNTAGAQFKLVFTPDMTYGNYYKLNASNPGQYYYNVLHYNDPLNPNDNTVTMSIPYPFVTQGATPIHVYSSVTINQNGGTCLIPGTEVSNQSDQLLLTGTFGNFQTVTVDVPEGFSYVNIHLDYGLKRSLPYAKGGSLNNDAIGVSPNTISIPDNLSYTFSNGGSQTIYSRNSFKKNPGVGGLNFVSIGGNPADYQFELWSPTGAKVGTGYLDEDGWYYISYKHTGKNATYKVKRISSREPTVAKDVSLKANGFVQVDFE